MTKAQHELKKKRDRRIMNRCGGWSSHKWYAIKAGIERKVERVLAHQAQAKRLRLMSAKLDALPKGE